MKKTLIALAAVAATSAAFAQSSVTLSGTVDTGFQKIRGGASMAMVNSRSGTSNWTMAGTEDLGGGMKAVYQISTSFNSDDGTTAANVLGNNGMFVGVTGGFGTVRMGRPVHLLWGNAGLATANGTKGVSGYDAATVLGGGVYVPNAVQYIGKFGPVTIQGEYAPKEAAAGNDGMGLAVRYDAGPLGLSFTNYKFASATAAKNKSVNQIGASYDMGVAKLFFTWKDDYAVNGASASNADSAWNLGATMPVGPGSAYVSYGVQEKAGSDATRLIAGYKYMMSKRTTVYVNFGSANTAAGVGAGLTAAQVAAGSNGVPVGLAAKSTTGYGIGLQHNF